MSGYTFLLRLIGLHLLLVGLIKIPGLQLILMACLELGYLTKTLQKYFTEKHLRSIRFLISYVAQPLFILTFLATCLVSILSTSNRDIPLKKATQMFLATILLMGTILEFVILLLNIFFLIYHIIKNRNKTKQDFVEYKIVFKDKEDKSSSKLNLVHPSQTKIVLAH